MFTETQTEQEPSEASSGRAPNPRSAAPDVDVAIVGAGLAGSLAALMLSRQGVSVNLFDLHGAPQPEFRAEQLVGAQIGRLTELGVLPGMTQRSRLFPVAVNCRGGKILDRTRVDQYGVPYHRMVEAARAKLPPAVRLFKGRVASLAATADRQTVTLSDGSVATARLLILATGLSTVLPKRLGLTSTLVRANHSLAFGFDLTLADPGATNLLPLIHYSETVSQKIDYLALFPMEDVLRANLFGYQDRDSAWTRAFCKHPEETLRAAMPGLDQILGGFTVTSPIQVRSNDLRVVSDPVREGVVLVGDAFQTPCPAAGTGIDRLLSDLGVLCGSHVPAWLSTPGMGAAKIAAYYNDPAKRVFDAECLRAAEYRRAVSSEDSFRWNLHRKQVLFRRKLRAVLARPGKAGARVPQSMAPLH